jgi:Nif-specific regulatory protein
MKNNHPMHFKADALIEFAQTLCHQKNFDERIYHTLHTSISGWVLKNGLPFLSKDIKSDPRFRQTVFKNINVKSILCAPLFCEDTLIGTFLLLNKTAAAEFDDNDLYYLEKLSSIVAPFLRNVQKVEEYFTPRMTQNALLKKYEALGLLGKCKTFIELLEAVEAAARCDVRVLLEGRSGTGKELVARAIHRLSVRDVYKFIAVDCGAIPEHLMESELFGHVKGAFTGAANARTGLFEEANNGTLFMDEITNLSLDLQAKLLRVLQEGEIRPLGSNITRKVNVRVITAASIPLREVVSRGEFREDLYYRLLVYPIRVPALEERQEDIPLLAYHFLQKFSQQQNKNVERFHQGIIDLIRHHAWSGNIRELENFVERLVTLTPQNYNQIGINLLPREFRMEWNRLKKHQDTQQRSKPLQEHLEEYEKELIRRVLIEHRWNQSSAANTLEIHESTLRYRMKKLGIKRRE